MSDRQDEELDGLRREVLALRARVAEMQRVAARHEDTEGISLAEREELLREAERIAHLGTWTWDMTSGRVTWSDEMHRILGIAPGSATPSVEVFFAAIHPDDRERAMSAKEQGIREGVLPLTDLRIMRPDGSIRHTVSTSSMLFDAQGQLRRQVGGVLDRTESLEVETKLRRALALLEEAQRLAKVGSFRFVPQTGELEWSSEFRRIAGLPLEDTPNVELFMQRVVPEERERFQKVYAEILVTPRSMDIEARLQRPNGERRHVRLTGVSSVGIDGRSEVRGTMLDVTDQVRLREELAHTQKMEAVGRLAGGIAHDFNNLLTVISANLDLLGRRIGAAKELDDSKRALSSAASLTQRLLAFGRKAQLQLKLVDPNDLVRSTLALMERLIGDEVRLQAEFGVGLPPVRVDPLEIERALVNLIVNARDVMPNGGTVHIATAIRTTDGALRVELSVADEGPGIPEADRPHIFEPFYTTRQHAGGTGLGLATVLGTAEQHGGTVRVQPRVGGGSIFTIELPAVQSPAVADPGLVPSRDAKVETRSLHVLVIDDQPMVADVARRILEMHGHLVRVAHDPEETFALWSIHGPTIDLVLCDVVMTHMRGPELIARLSRSEPRPRVLFMTGYSDEAVDTGLGHPVVAKPFTASELARAIDDVMMG